MPEDVQKIKDRSKRTGGEAHIGESLKGGEETGFCGGRAWRNLSR